MVQRQKMLIFYRNLFCKGVLSQVIFQKMCFLRRVLDRENEFLEDFFWELIVQLYKSIPSQAPFLFVDDTALLYTTPFIHDDKSSSCKCIMLDGLMYSLVVILYSFVAHSSPCTLTYRVVVTIGTCLRKAIKLGAEPIAFGHLKE